VPPTVVRALLTLALAGSLPIAAGPARGQQIQEVVIAEGLTLLDIDGPDRLKKGLRTAIEIARQGDYPRAADELLPLRREADARAFCDAQADVLVANYVTLRIRGLQGLLEGARRNPRLLRELTLAQLETISLAFAVLRAYDELRDDIARAAPRLPPVVRSHLKRANIEARDFVSSPDVRRLEGDILQMIHLRRRGPVAP